MVCSLKNKNTSIMPHAQELSKLNMFCFLLFSSVLTVISSPAGRPDVSGAAQFGSFSGVLLAILLSENFKMHAHKYG